MEANGHWTEIDESLARELGWKPERRGWRDPGGQWLPIHPQYIGNMNAMREIFEYCRDRGINVVLYLEGSRRLPLDVTHCFCTLWGKQTVRAEAFELTLALAKAFLILRRISDVPLQDHA